LDFKDYVKPFKNTIKIIHSEKIYDVFDDLFDDEAEEENLIVKNKTILR